MTTETTVSPVAETQNPAPEVVETPEVTKPEVVAEAETAPEAPPEEPPKDDAQKAIERMQRRIDKRTADLYRERAAKEQLAQRVAQFEAQSGIEEPREGVDDVERRALEIASVREFTAKANSIVSEGTKAHGDYMDALKELAGEVGDFVKPNGAPSLFMQAVMEVTEKPVALLYHLGKNPDIAAELSDLTPMQLAKKLDRIERELMDRSTPKPSNAPKPLTPVKAVSSAKPDLSDPNLPYEQWVRLREKELAARRR